MCEKCGCAEPEEKPEECSEEQISECHPDSGGHPCCEEKPEESNQQD